MRRSADRASVSTNPIESNDLDNPKVIYVISPHTETQTPSPNSDAASVWKVSPAAYGSQRAFEYDVPLVPESFYLTMSDGIRLAADVHLPQREGRPTAGKRPTILVFTPYYRRFNLKVDERTDEVEASPNTAKYRDLFTPAGYNVVVVDVRGTGASFGNRQSFRSPAERSDYKEVADWVCRQQWSDGTIGVTGISYLGAASDFLASTGHPAVKAIAPLFSVWDTYENNYFPGGVQLFDLIESYSQLMIGLDQDDRQAIQPYAAYADPAFDGPAPVDADPDRAERDAAVRDHRSNYRHADMMREFAMREKPLAYDPDFSSASFSPYSYSAGIRSDVAIYSVSGWMDGAGYANGAVSRFLTMNENPHHLLLGPWDHGARSHVSPWSPDGLPDDSWWFEILRFFDEYLRGTNTGIRDEDPVHYYALHTEKWQSSTSWPPRSAESEFALTSAGDAGAIVPCAEADDRASSPEPEGSHGSDTLDYRVDFGTGTGTNTRYERIAGKSLGRYYSDWQGRTDDHLVFDSPVLDRPFTLSGHAAVSLRLASDQPDATVFVYISEVEADGTQRYVTEGLLRLLHRAESDNPAEISTNWVYRSFREEDASPLVPGSAETVRIPCLPTAWRFSAGSRIRLSLSGSDSDHATQSPYGRPPLLSVFVDGSSTLSLPGSRWNESPSIDVNEENF